jgi:hypothetical protein
MPATVTDDPLLRENRRSELVRRLISHTVRTGFIATLTGFSRNRQATMRRWLGVPDKSRWRGPARSLLELFLQTSHGLAEGAALVALCTVFDIPIDAGAASLPEVVSLTFTDRLCETYEAFRALFPQTQIELEELILLRSSVAKGDIRLGKCRTCKGLILINPYDGGHRTSGGHPSCAHCVAPVA